MLRRRHRVVLEHVVRGLGCLLVVCISQTAFAQTGPSLTSRLRPPLVAAHRGGEFGLPNTLAQFAEALGSDNADILEMDLQLTADGKVVVFHDDALDKKSNCVGRIEDKTYAELLRCKLTNGERIALFSDVLALVDGRKMVSAELKSDGVVVPASRLALSAGALNWVFFQVGENRARYQLLRAFSHQLAVMAKVEPNASTRWVFDAKDPNLKIVEVDRDSVNERIVSALHAQHKLVSMNTWRYQFTEERFVASCDRAFEEGIDIAVTNNPESCHRQKVAWSLREIDSGQFYDRQHVRVWARRHSGAMRRLSLGSGLLFLTLTILFAVRGKLNAFRLKLARRVIAVGFMAMST